MPSPDTQRGFAILSAVTWALVMYLFRKDRKDLVNGLRVSMEYIYEDSDWVTNASNSTLSEITRFFFANMP